MTMSCSRFLWIAAGAAVLASAPPVRAADPSNCPPDASPSAPAQRIAIDPRTGMIAGVPPSASAAPRTATRSAPLAGVRLESGATRVDLKGRYQMAVVAHRDASGKVTTSCAPAETLPPAGGGEVAREK